MRMQVFIAALCLITGAAMAQSLDKPPQLWNLEQKFVEAEIKEEKLVITSQDEWKKLWSRFSPDAPPVVDFSAYDVAVYLMGVQPSSGYAAVAKDIHESEKEVKIKIQRCIPGRGGALTVLTAPSVTEWIPKLNGRIPAWEIDEASNDSKACVGVFK